jgi:integrase/recombinase XerD
MIKRAILGMKTPRDTRAEMKIKLKYLVEDMDRHGNVRCYVRLPGKAKVRIRGLPGSALFMDEYQAAVAGKADQPRQARTAKRGSFRHLCQLYYASPTFKALDPSTQAWRRRALDAISDKYGANPVALMEARHVRRIRDERADQPGAANTRLKAMHALFRWAVDEDEATRDPTRDVRKIKYATKGHHSWTVEEIELFKARHPLGTKPRLALDLLRFTTGRREDVVRLGRQHVRNGRVQFRQAKNEHRAPVDIDIPVHFDLEASIQAMPTQHLTFLVTEYGRPYTPAGFGNAMRDWCNQANLRHCSAHGLRKATPTQMAENGATAHELMAITGHQSLEEVERYTRAARRTKLADSAMAKLKG